MTRENWIVRLTVSSSTKESVRELAAAESRSMSNYLSRIIEQKVREARHERAQG